MANVQIVIELDEGMVKSINENPFGLYNGRLYDAIRDGRVLPKGHWIYDDEYSDWVDVTYKCSCCKRAIIVPYEARDEVYKDYPYCHCGVKMEIEDD